MCKGLSVIEKGIEQLDEITSKIAIANKQACKLRDTLKEIDVLKEEMKI